MTDLLVGLFLLAWVAIGIVTWSPILALAVVVIVVGCYLFGLYAWEQSRRR